MKCKLHEKFKNWMLKNVNYYQLILCKSFAVVEWICHLSCELKACMTVYSGHVPRCEVAQVRGKLA